MLAKPWPMLAGLPLVFGSSAGYNVVVNVQMRGVDPGDPTNLFNPTNPRTRVLSYFADTGVPLNRYEHCPYRVGYRPVDATTYVLDSGISVIFDVCWRVEHLVGKPIRIKLEVLDSNNRYTTDERVAWMVAPPEGTYPTDEPVWPGCEGFP